MGKPYAIVTEASSGLGLELARQLAERGHNLLLVSSSDDIFNLQEELEAYGGDVGAFKVDLSSATGVENFLSVVFKEHKKIDALVLNPADCPWRNFLDKNLRQDIRLINHNLLSFIHLTKKLLPYLLEQGEGKILFSAPFMSEESQVHDPVLKASGAFMTSFVKALRKEVKDSQVSLSLLLSPPFHVAESSRSEEIAEEIIDAFMAGKENIYPGNLIHRIQNYAMKILPEKARAQRHRKETGPDSSSH